MQAADAEKAAEVYADIARQVDVVDRKTSLAVSNVETSLMEVEHRLDEMDQNCLIEPVNWAEVSPLKRRWPAGSRSSPISANAFRLTK